MKNIAFKYLLSLVIVLITSFNSVQAQQSEIKPKKFVSAVYMNGSSDFIYYALSEKSKTTIMVNGPGKLTVYNRVRLENNVAQSTPYYLKYIVDGKKVATKKVGPQKLSKKVRYKNSKLKGKPSKADKETILVSLGKHQITFYKYKTKQKAHVRFVFTPSKKIKWKEMADSTLSKINLQYVKTKKSNQYTRIDQNQSFHLVTGKENKKIRIFLRADFTYKTHTTNTVRLVLKSEDGTQKVYKLTTKKSNTVENLSDKHLIPGKLEKIYIDLPLEKEQSYELSLKDKNQSALIRVFIDDQKEVAITETASK